MVCLSLIASECYAHPPQPDVYIWDWHKYTTVGENVDVYAEVYDYDSTATFYSDTPGEYTVYAYGTDYYEQTDYDWAYVYVMDVEIDTPSSFPAYVALGENHSLGSTLTPASADSGTYVWAKVTGSGTVTFSPIASAEDPNFSADQAGDYTVKVEYTKEGATASDTSGTITVVDVEMKLEKVGNTTIEAANTYSENTTIRVTAVNAANGQTCTWFTGSVNIAEDTSGQNYVEIYSQNGGYLPGSITFTAGDNGVKEFVAESLAGPKDYSHPPDPASIKTTNYDVYDADYLYCPTMDK